MIESITIKNFESHKNTKLDLHPGVNVIVGESDHGKSSIMRALNLLVNNRPSGNEFIRDGEINAVVKVKIDNHIIKRKKGKENLYYLDGKKFKISSDRTVPEKIAKILNISDFNLQKQLDSHFLLSESSAEVARYFNKIVKLDVIDSSSKKIIQRITNDTRKFKEAKVERKELRKSVKEYDWLVGAEDKLRKLELTERSISKTANQIREIDALITEIKLIKKEREKLLKFSKAKPIVNKLIALSNKIKKEEREYDELSDLIIDIEWISERIQKKKKEKKTLEKQFKELMPNVCPLCNQEVKNGTNSKRDKENV